MSEENLLLCLEFYGDSLCHDLLAAIDVPHREMEKAMKGFGRALCRMRRLRAVEVVALDGRGETVFRRTIYAA